MPGFEVFVSYSRHDEPIVIPIVKLLRLGEHGIVFLDLDSIEPGELWRGKLEAALGGAKYVVLFWCEHSSNSREVEREYRAALATGKRLVPVLLDRTPLPPGLDEYQWIDLAALASATHSHAPQVPSPDPFADLLLSAPSAPAARPTPTLPTVMPSTERAADPAPKHLAKEFDPFSAPAPTSQPIPAPERLPDDFDPFADEDVSLDAFFGLGSAAGRPDPLSHQGAALREISEMADAIGTELLRHAKRDGLV